MSKYLTPEQLAPRYDALGKRTIMARSGGYLMVRRPYYAPSVMTEKEWLKLSPVPLDEKDPK